MKEQTKSFYSSKLWCKARLRVLERDNHLCQLCFRRGLLIPAEVVHHIEHLSNAPGRALEESNLVSVCSARHNSLHPEKGKCKKQDRKVRVVRVKANEEMV